MPYIRRVIRESAIETHLRREFSKRIQPVYPEAQDHKYEIRKSEPDRLWLLPNGLVVFIECKRPGKDLRKDQARAFERLRKLGFDCFRVNSREEADSVITTVLEKLNGI